MCAANGPTDPAQDRADAAIEDEGRSAVSAARPFGTERATGPASV